MDFQTLFKKARAEVLAAALGAVSLIAIFFPFLTVSFGRFGSAEADLFDISSFFAFIVLALTIFYVALAGMVVFSTYQGSEVSLKQKVKANVAGAVAGGLALVIAVFATLLEKESSMDFGWGFFVYIVVGGSAVVVSATEAMKNKSVAKEVLTQVKNSASNAVKNMSNSNNAQPTEPKNEEKKDGGAQS